MREEGWWRKRGKGGKGRRREKEGKGENEGEKVVILCGRCVKVCRKSIEKY